MPNGQPQTGKAHGQRICGGCTGRQGHGGWRVGDPGGEDPMTGGPRGPVRNHMSHEEIPYHPQRAGEALRLSDGKGPEGDHGRRTVAAARPPS